MTKFMLVDAEDMERLRRAMSALAEQLADMHQRVSGAVGELADLQHQLEHGLAWMAFDALTVPEQSSVSLHNGLPKKRYRIGRYSYADVVDEIIEDDEFSLDDAWRQIRDLILTHSDRARDGMRQSLDNDERFRRAGKDQDGAIWYRRVDPANPDQLALTDEMEEVAVA